MHPSTDFRIVEKEAPSLAKKYETYLIMGDLEDKVVGNLHYIGVNVPKSRVKRMISLKPFLQKMLEVDADVYHFEDPELLPLRRRLQKSGKKVIFDSHENFAELILTKLWIPKVLRRPLSLLFGVYQKINLPKFDAVITVTPFLVKRFKKYNPNTYMVTNYPILTPFSDKRKWGNSVCFAGAIMWEWMHDKIIDSLDKTNSRYLLAGGQGPYFDSLKSKENWNKVDYVGRLTHEEILEFLQKGSAAMHVSSYNDPNTGYKEGTLGVNKLFEYMAAGVPIITSAHKVWKEIIDNYKCGICVDPEDPNDIANAINTFVNNKDLALEMGNNARRAAEEEFNWAKQEEVLFSIYDKLLSE